MTIAIVGTGFVGVVTSAVFASHGHKVWGIDIDEKKVALLNQGQVPFYEPELDELVNAGLTESLLKFTTNYEEAVSEADCVMVAVGTPSSAQGKADLSYVFSACQSLAPHLKKNAVVVIKSTVPPGSFAQVEEILKKFAKVSYHLASVPEFLREGTAVSDTKHPDRIVLGVSHPNAQALLEQLHKPFQAPIIIVKPESAQLGKYAANAYLALRIGFINQIADFCEKTGANIHDVIKIIGLDKRIGSHYWYPGLGYGGSCFPKDVKELAYTSKQFGMEETLFTLLDKLNVQRLHEKFKDWESSVGGWKNKKVAVLGLSFKPNTTDLREAPSLFLIPALLKAGALIQAYDPMATGEARAWFESMHQKTPLTNFENLHFVNDLSQALQDAEVVIALVEWPQIITYSFAKTGQSTWFIDARNQFNAEKLIQLGYRYIGIGLGNNSSLQ